MEGSKWPRQGLILGVGCFASYLVNQNWTQVFLLLYNYKVDSHSWIFLLAKKLNILNQIDILNLTDITITRRLLKTKCESVFKSRWDEKVLPPPGSSSDVGGAASLIKTSFPSDKRPRPFLSRFNQTRIQEWGGGERENSIFVNIL